MEYIKNRAEGFDYYYPCMNKKDLLTAAYHMFTNG
jgi:hypothetical protein